MKKQLSIIIGCLLVTAGLVFGDATISFDDHINDPNIAGTDPAAGIYTIGQSFSFDITIQSDGN